MSDFGLAQWPDFGGRRPECRDCTHCVVGSETTPTGATCLFFAYCGLEHGECPYVGAVETYKAAYREAGKQTENQEAEVPKLIADEIADICENIKKLFQAKQAQYSTAGDELANFRYGALLACGKDDYASMLTELKGYARKHIAYVEHAGIDSAKLAESLQDIAVYAMIAMVMVKRHRAAEDAEDGDHE